MEYFVNFSAISKTLKKLKHCRLDSFVIHLAAQTYEDTFSSERLAKEFGINHGRVKNTLNRSPMIKSDGDKYKARANTHSLYKDSFMALIQGHLRPASFRDVTVSDVLAHDPAVDYLLAVVGRHGDFLTVLGMSVLLAIKEGHSDIDSLQKRLDVDDAVLNALIDDLVTNHEALSVVIQNGLKTYHFTEKSNDIMSIIFKGKTSQGEPIG